MKKLFLIILGVSICLFFAGCTKTTDQTINGTNSDDPSSPTLYEAAYFDSFQHITQLKKYIENADDPKSLEFDEYIYENYNGAIAQKAAVSRMFDNLDGLNMLILDSSSGYELIVLNYYSPGYGDSGFIEYCYKNGDKLIRFHSYVDANGTVASKFAESNQELEIADKMDFGGEEVVLYSVAGESKISFRCCINTSNSLIDIRFYDDDINVAKDVIEKYAISTTLNELIG